MFHVSCAMFYECNLMCHLSFVMFHVAFVGCHLSCVMCHVSCIMCHVQCFMCHMPSCMCNFLWYVSCVMFHVSYVTWHVSDVMWQLLFVMCHESKNLITDLPGGNSTPKATFVNCKMSPSKHLPSRYWSSLKIYYILVGRYTLLKLVFQENQKDKSPEPRW